jgi:predicted nucleic acid-binding protein
LIQAWTDEGAALCGLAHQAFGVICVVTPGSAGARAQREGAVLRDLERALPELKIDDDVWAASFDLARRARANGITVPATDILIAARALHHGAGIETSDSDFDALNSLRTNP